MVTLSEMQTVDNGPSAAFSILGFLNVPISHASVASNLQPSAPPTRVIMPEGLGRGHLALLNGLKNRV
ncbi:MAG TPA: hypothetical protein VN944_04995 [Nitrospiria bacterium]|nr:hypothetical protein [Nitrospiria bacterium]